jgi:hypothetical protein
MLCECSNTEHQLIFNYWEEDDWPEVYASIHLVKEKNFFKRLWHGLKYIFGHTSKYGDFDEVVLKPKDWEKLQNVTDFLKKSYQKRNDKTDNRKLLTD